MVPFLAVLLCILFPLWFAAKVQEAQAEQKEETLLENFRRMYRRAPYDLDELYLREEDVNRWVEGVERRTRELKADRRNVDG